MSETSVNHAKFVVDRIFDAPPALMFGAFADPAVKARWFVGPPGWTRSAHELDFRVGGHERASGGPPGGTVHAYEARYHDIVPEQRIVLTYDMHLDRKRISVSLVTIEFRPVGISTRLIYTEQVVFLDGADTSADRQEGTQDLLDNLEKAIHGELTGS